jgi:NADH-quinone oxidoreductase subunit H
LGLEVFGVILAGYSSGSKWSLFGAMREAAQVVSYEVPLGLCVVLPVFICGTMNLVTIGNMQSGLFTNWLIFHDPFTFVVFWVYFTCAVASVNRAPFDLAEAESELVAGFHTEYSGMRFAMFFLAEYAAMYLVSAVAATIFLGGWWTGIPLLDDIGAGADASTLAVVFGFLLKAAAIISKAMLLVFVQMWLRWTLPRMRLDQMMYVCWKVLLPASLVGLIGSVLWELAVGGQPFFGIPALFGTCLLGTCPFGTCLFGT